MKLSHYVPELKKELTIEVDGAGRAATPPHVLGIEPTNRCNLKCVHCHHRYMTGRADLPTGDLKLSTFTRMRPMIKKASMVFFTGFGEPYLYPQLFELLRSTKAMGTLTAVTTNGTHLDKLRSVRTVESGLDYLEVSVDGLDANVSFRGHHGRDTFKRIRALHRLKKDMGSETPKLSVATVLGNSNTGDLLNLVLACVDSGVEEMRVQPIQVLLNKSKDENIYRDKGMAETALAEAAELADIQGLDFIVRRSSLKMDERYSHKRRYLTPYHDDLVCIEPFSRFYVGWDGAHYICCGGLPSGHNINDELPERIWNMEPYLTLRRELMALEPNEKCSHCNQIYGSLDNQETLVDN